MHWETFHYKTRQITNCNDDKIVKKNYSFLLFHLYVKQTQKGEQKRTLPDFNNNLTISASPTFVAKYNGGTPSSDGNCISLGRTCKFTSAPSFISSVASFNSLYLKFSWNMYYKQLSITLLRYFKTFQAQNKHK